MSIFEWTKAPRWNAATPPRCEGCGAYDDATMRLLFTRKGASTREAIDLCDVCRRALVRPTDQTQPVIYHISMALEARMNCRHSGNLEWVARHTAMALDLVKTYMPSGSGLDRGVNLDMENSDPIKVVLLTTFHHMSESGIYDGWTDHKIIVKPRFDGFTVDVTGHNRNRIKEYLSDVFHDALSQHVAEDHLKQIVTSAHGVVHAG